MASGEAAVLNIQPEDSPHFAGFARGPFSPAAKEYVIENTSAVPVSWSVKSDQPWVSAMESRGMLEAGASTNVQIFPNSVALTLASGSYTSSLIISNHTFGEWETRPVSVEVRVPGPGRVEYPDLSLTNKLRLVISGVVGTTYVVERAISFKAWEPVFSGVFVSTTASIEVDLTSGPRRFYRAYSLGANATPAQLALTNIFVPDTSKVRVVGDADATYLVESSNDNVHWFPVATNKTSAAGDVILTNIVVEPGQLPAFRATGLDAFAADSVHHVLIVGQSLAIGFKGDPPLSTAPMANHFRVFHDGFSTAWAPLRELGSETIASGAALHVTSQATDHHMAFSNTGVGGAGYELLKKGTIPYATGLDQWRYAPQLAACANYDLKPSAIFVVHGEADHINPAYDLDIREWQSDFQADCRQVTGQDVAVPMFHSQASAWTSPLNGSATITLGAFKVLAESEANPDRTVLVCPKYFLPYADGIHLTNRSYRWLGEYYAKAYKKVVIDGQRWTPLKPLQVTRAGVVVTAQFHVPYPPLVFDTLRVSDPGHFGFTFYDDSGAPPEILSVQLAGADTVHITLSAEPTGADERLRYAFSGIAGNPGGPELGPRGNLRDSDPESSLFGETLFNWCVHFDHALSP